MNVSQHHIVRRQFLDLEILGSEAEGLALQRTSATLNGGLLAALDELLTQLVPHDEHWLFDRLDLSVGPLPLERVERDLVAAVTSALEKQIQERIGTPVGRPGPRDASVDDARLMTSRSSPAPMPHHAAACELRTRTETECLHDAFIYFLELGLLPWWFRLPAGQTLEQVLTASWSSGASRVELVPPLLAALHARHARLRLVRQFSPAFVTLLLSAVAPAAADVIRNIAADLARHEAMSERGRDLTQSLWQVALEQIASKQPLTVAHLLEAWLDLAPSGEDGRARDAVERFALAQAHADGRSPSDPNGPATNRRAASAPMASGPLAPKLELAEGLFVECAGLVLLHPFLPTLFERLQVSADGSLLEPERALALLHYLATGEIRAPEYALAMPKVLCGFPLEQPAGTPVSLSEPDQSEASGLLAAVVEHWDALGGASADALRGTFLVRPGKLSLREDGYLLQIEPQSFDVLLDRLPWGIGAIRLPWMDKFLWVEWRM